MRYHAGVDLPLGCLHQLRDDFDSLLTGDAQQARFPSGVTQLRERSDFTIIADKQYDYGWMLHFRSSFPRVWGSRDIPPKLDESNDDPFAANLIVRLPVGRESIQVARHRLQHFLRWLGEKAPGC